ncbi:alkaline phosphatase family protein [Mucilaginibacter sp. dw_454]|uniref:alkaline phosphatase family protein n=1 Tax=Mucilaginibacter sp. dw_454 TaxID=2720079 RepID=UPI001BD3DEF1|nr:alkaline phosphatase family protein [Mucilaginibacter sp. dw_454]
MRCPNRLLRAAIVILVFCAVSCAKETKIPVSDPNSNDSTVATAPTTTKVAGGTTTSTHSSQSPVVQSNPDNSTPYNGCCATQNVIIIVMDGPRYSETWGDYTFANIPNEFALYGHGVMLANFRNLGTTNTDSGHDAICTGNYENLENTGQVLPMYPSIFQEFLKATGKPAEKAWVVASKDKLQILANCQTAGWANQYMPRADCGINGLFSGYRSDDTTFVHSERVLATYHPNLMLINFKDPDVHGHSSDWPGYIAAIKKTDEYIKQIYDFVENDNVYRGKTTFIITNDHGRHLPNVADGFISHGDGCDGCRHIGFLGLGPDFQQGIGFDTPYEQVDISATVAKLLHFNMDYGQGKVITDIFR